MRIAPSVTLSEQDRRQLETRARSRCSPARIVERARIVLFAAKGLRNDQIASKLRMTRQTVARWRDRFLKRGVAGIEKDAPRPGRKPKISPALVQEVVRKTTQEKPTGATHWSTRTMAKAVGVSEKSVRRVWHAHGLKPHLARTFKISHDPRFVEKLEDVVNLYLSPPADSIVLSLDEKSQIQALDRTQPGLPLKKGRCETMTHDYKRHGTTTLFAALDVATGIVFGQCRNQHTHQDWLGFLRDVDRSVPRDKAIHLIGDNHATHKHVNAQNWLERHPRFHMHFTPTSSSWLNMVERFFRDLTDKCARRSVSRSVAELKQALHNHIAAHNRDPKPFIWTAKAFDILEKVKRARSAARQVPIRWPHYPRAGGGDCSACQCCACIQATLR